MKSPAPNSDWPSVDERDRLLRHVSELRKQLDSESAVADRPGPAKPPSVPCPEVPTTTEDKIALFMDLFRGRQDVFAADALRAPKHVVFGHRLDECDHFRGKSHRLALGPGPAPPDELEEIPMPTQQRLGRDDLQGVSPSAAQPDQDEQEHAVIAVYPWSPDTATEYD
jgi:hypothetical protein